MLRAKLRQKANSDMVDVEAASEIDSRLVRWSSDALASDQAWHFATVAIPDSPQVWNGTIYTYRNSFAPGVWMTFRSIRIMIIRTQESLYRSLPLPAAEIAEQARYFRTVRHQMTDEICATVPVALGHTGLSCDPSGTLISAYNVIWPLFLASISASERRGMQGNDDPAHCESLDLQKNAQLTWILGRLDYISTHVGVKLATDVAEALRNGDSAAMTDYHESLESDGQRM